MSIKKIESNEEWKKIQSETDSYFLLKNSTTCPISSEALTEIEKYAEANAPFPVYYLNVQELRDLSNQIAEDFSIKHETPQLFFIQNNEVTWHASHWKITKKNAEKAAANA
ncbi:bacillithiol system redox-active protein YtxJ [Salipaludibacillus daqingensis]|uniref:bacillithiol system redox-active protein YtxJ n=1 Tax=Salipaludibacillus daqingensis TaxID=3041001 RepID=UPI0024758478|nr:bacillithiol system redox-active protein YtxJ [Salipaludibacillus daqingensis]